MDIILLNISLNPLEMEAGSVGRTLVRERGILVDGGRTEVLPTEECVGRR